MNRIKEIRERQGLTRDQLADRLGGPITSATIQRIEDGTIRLDIEKLQEIAKALGVKSAELLPPDD